MKDPAEAFRERAQEWREHYNRRTSQRQLLNEALKDDKTTLASLAERYDSAVRMHQTQLKLYRSLAANQKLALQDGVITREVFGKHIARLDRMMNERLYYLWGHSLPEDWNAVLAKLPKAKRPSFHPLPVSPSQEDWERFRLKDHTPIYEKAEKSMRTVRPGEAGAMEGGAR
ncbi:MAG: hypothetical protein AAB412_04015 [Elusimicrobiota bacterium]